MGQKIDRTALAQRIREIEGLSNEERSALLELVNTQKRYGLVWEEKVEDVEERLREQMPVLKEVEDRRILSEDKDAPNHMIIEGDNLEALTALTYTHEGKIDLIYIDPPYNTGKEKDFKYNDQYVDKEDAFRHSKWLSFMKKRLKIARKLLSKKGTIFISIDDHSVAQLKLLCDDIFEYSTNPDNLNYLTTLIWNKQHSQQQGTFKRYHEYVLVYAKNAKEIKNVLIESNGVIEAGAMKKISKKNPASCFTFPKGTKFEAPDGTKLEGIYGDSEQVTVISGNFEALNQRLISDVTLSAGWTQKKQMQSWFSGNDVYDTKNQRIIEFYFNSKGKIKCRKERLAVTPCTILPLFGMGSEQTAHLEDILGKKDAFTNPKPVEMIKLFIDWFCPKNGIILDYFAGSGTTMESSLICNSEDVNSKRQCILVTNNENNICEEVTYERNKRVIEGYTTPKAEHVEGLKGNNLRYYKTELLPRGHSMENMRRLMNASTDLLCIKEGVYCEQEYLGGLRLKAHLARYFDDGERRMLIIYREETIDRLVEEIKGIDVGEHKIKVYAFSPSRIGYEEDFESVWDKVIVSAMPAPIYDAEEKVMPKKNTEWLNDVEEEEVGL